ncbi:MAG: alpha/beta hydrolase [Armatimonadetes bacterium]|nr:alpha/beta hydrolase [Armatimonadota bacterium]
MSLSLRILAFALFCVSAIAGAQIPRITSGTISHYEKFDSKYVDARNIDVWLPEGYGPGEKYSVIYMQDGQTLFDDQDADHPGWKIDERISELVSERRLGKCIVVAIASSPKWRWSEYFPQGALKYMAPDVRADVFETSLMSLPQSDNYLHFLTKELMPFIGKRFNVYKDPKHNILAGSSMGALISLTALCEYPKLFGGAICMSTHWQGTQKNSDAVAQAIQDYFRAKLPKGKEHRLYFDHGTVDMDAGYKPWQDMMDLNSLRLGYGLKNYASRTFEGEGHSAAFWGKRFHYALEFMLGAAR